MNYFRSVAVAVVCCLSFNFLADIVSLDIVNYMVQRSALNALLYDGLEDTWLSSVVSSFGKAVKPTHSCKLPLCSDLCIVRRISRYSVSVIDSISSIDFLPFIQFRAVGAEAYGSSNRARGRVDHGQAVRLTSMLTYTPTVNLELLVSL